ncbi:MAG TPA: MFS transporter, partial [Promineifilum sp.]|nr:MFS transporter [Promineifilum sp.]HRO90550.1 MFS transporter [Promineifilum sp.]
VSMASTRPYQRLLYGVGSIGVALSYQAFSTYIQFLYIDTLGVRAAWIGLVWAVYGIWNSINDPLAGYLSDRTRTRWGRRLPWMYGALLPLVITFYLLWFPFKGVNWSEFSLLFYFLAIVLAFDLFWTVFVMNWTSLFPEMVSSESDRTGLSALRESFSIVGLLVGVALPPLIAGADWSNRGQMAYLLTAVTLISLLLTLFGSKERREFAAEPSPPFRESLRLTLGNRDFLFFLAANLMIQYVFLGLAAAIPFYAKYVLKIQGPTTLGGVVLDAEMQNSLLLAAAFLAALPAMVVWLKLSQRFGAWKTLRAASLVGAAIALYFFFPTTFVGGLLGTILFGLVLAALLMLTNPLLADITDADEVAHGARREGMFFGMNGLVIRFAFVIQGILTAIVFSLTGYVSPSAGVLNPIQPESALFGMRLLTGGTTAVALVAAFLLLGGYSLHGRRAEKIRAEAAAMQEEKKLGMGEN